MRLNCSKNNELFIDELKQWMNETTFQNPAEVIQRHPQLAHHISNDREALSHVFISRDSWRSVLRDFLLRKFTGPHKELSGIFASCIDTHSSQCFLGRYQLVSLLGTGSDACTFKTADGFCLKVVPEASSGKLFKEHQILQNLRHKNIVECYDCFCGEGYAAMRMERLYPVWGNAHEYSAGLAYCHSHGYLHGDLRLNNLGTDSAGHSKLFDFGNARIADSPDELLHETVLLKNIMNSPIASGGTVC